MSAPGNEPAGRRQSRGVPPLAWLVIGLLVVIAAIAYFSMDGARTPPSGGPAAPVDVPNGPTVVDPAPTPTAPVENGAPTAN